MYPYIMRNQYIYFYISLLLFCACQKQSFDFKTILLRNDKLATIIKEAGERNLQITLTEIKRVGKEVRYKEHTYNHKPNQYFYPASTVKLPLALLSLEYCAQNDKITSTTSFKINSDTRHYGCSIADPNIITNDRISFAWIVFSVHSV